MERREEELAAAHGEDFPLRTPPPEAGQAVALAGLLEEKEGGKTAAGDVEMDDVSPPPPPSVAGGEEEEECPAFGTAGAGDEATREGAVDLVAEPVVEDASLAGTGKRRRGRPPKNRGAIVGRPPAKKKDEEVVCFICFDGGSLVCCDRRGCPKVYHPPCINRDETFFRTKGRWNCGWHICSNCQKAAHYMCYTCTYSLCKGCIGGARFFCVKANKGFCETCYRTVMLIESNQHLDEKMVGVNFDDKNSWEYLFKEYWLGLKEKLSLLSEEVINAKDLWKGFSVSAYNEESSDELYNANEDDDASSDNSSGNRKGNMSSRKKVRKLSKTTVDEERSTKEVNSEKTYTAEGTEWASQELLELVAHMRHGDTSVQTQFDVQALLLEYIKQNNLRDPRKKSQIICDARLQNLFGKQRVGHFEMLKLLESHFYIKEAADADNNQEETVDPDSCQMDPEGYNDVTNKISSDKRKKSHKKIEERELHINLDDYAAIDVHNISLVYLRRSLMEDLVDNIDTFDEKVVGSFVRIRISSTGQRQDMYRLVQIVGTQMVAEKYKIGKKTTDIALEVLNLDKKEVITIDTISNQEFTEEECKRLRQSIKCGLIGRLTVGEVQEKARVLQAMRVNDWLESEKLRLSHLRDRASETGRRKELRECVEKLQLLSTPEERMRRLSEVPDVHADPHMDPTYESAEEQEVDDKKGDNYGTSRDSSFHRRGRELFSPGKGGSVSNYKRTNAQKSSSTSWVSNRSSPTESAQEKSDTFGGVVDRTSELSWTHVKDAGCTKSCEAPKLQASVTTVEGGAWNNNQLVMKPGQSCTVGPETMSASLSSAISVPPNMSENDKVWHYQDPSGKIQGPFTMAQLRKWSTNGYFPPDLRVWLTSEKKENSIFLTDALQKFRKGSPQQDPPHNCFPQHTNYATVSGNGDGTSGSNTTWVGSCHNGSYWSASQNATFAPPGNIIANSNRWATQSSDFSVRKIDMVSSQGGRIGLSPSGCESSNGIHGWYGLPQNHNGPRPNVPLPGNPYGSPSSGGRGSQGENAGIWNRSQDPGTAMDSNRPRGLGPNAQSYGKRHSNWSSLSQQSQRNYGELRNVQPSNDFKVDSGSNSYSIPTTSQPSRGEWNSAQGSFNTSSTSTTASVQLKRTGFKEAQQSPATTMEQTRGAPAAISVGVRGSNSASNELMQSGVAGGWGSRSALLPTKEEIVSMNNATNWSVPASKRSQFFESDCPSPTPSSGRQELPIIQPYELDHDKKCSEAHDGLAGQSLGSDLSPVALASPSQSLAYCHEVDNEKSPSKVMDEDVADAGLIPEMQNLSTSNSLFSEVENNQSSLQGVEDKLVDPAMSTNPVAESNLLDPFSAQRLESSSTPKPTYETEGLPPALILKQESDGSGVGSASSASGQESNQTQRREPSFSGREPLKSSNWEGMSQTNSSEWSLPSPTPGSKASGWFAGPNSISGDKDVRSTGSGMAPENPNAGTQAVQGNENVCRGTAIQGNVSTDWGTMTNVNTKVDRETPSQETASANTGWETPAKRSIDANPTGWGTTSQRDTNANSVWGTPIQGNTNAKSGWEAPSQRNRNPNAGWGTPTQGNTATPGWEAPTEGNSNPKSAWDAPLLGNINQNPSWGALPRQENTNDDSGWGTALGENRGWNSPSGNSGGWDTRRKNSGDRYSDGSRSAHCDARNQRSRFHSYPGEGRGLSRDSRPPPRGQGQIGVCKFHESGYCRKGASCKYLHPQSEQ